MIIMALVLGLGTGYFALLRLNRCYAITKEEYATSKKEESHHYEESYDSTYLKNEGLSSTNSNQGSNENGKLDATYTSISPCCDEVGNT
jgi:hypothetical protein